MARNDELDTLICDNRLADPDFADLYEILGIKAPVAVTQRREILNREIRHSYGHTVANLFREWFEPDYVEILKGIAGRLKLPLKDHNTVDEIEDKILVEIIELARDQIIKEKGAEAWAKIERDVDAEIERLIAEGKIPKDVADKLKNLRGAALIAAIIGGRFAGFALFIVANQVFFAIARFLGLGIGVAVAGPIIGRALAFLLGPAGWLLGAALLVYDLGNTNWGKVIPSVVMVIVMRRRLKFGDDGMLVEQQA